MVTKPRKTTATKKTASKAAIDIIHVEWRGPYSPIFIAKDSKLRVQEIIKKYNLKPQEVIIKGAQVDKARIPQLINGGMKALHIHFNGDTYLLTQEQWREFSGRMVMDFKQKLTDAKSIGFDQMLGLGEAMSGIL